MRAPARSLVVAEMKTLCRSRPPIRQTEQYCVLPPPMQLSVEEFWGMKMTAYRAEDLTQADRDAAHECAYRGRRPRCPAHGDHVIQSMTTGAARELDGAVGFIF